MGMKVWGEGIKICNSSISKHDSDFRLAPLPQGEGSG